MNYRFLEQYRSYKTDGGSEDGLDLANHLYRCLSAWIENGKPDQEFLAEMGDLMAEIQENPLSEKDLIDLGLYHTAEALQNYEKSEDADFLIEFYLNEARLPFFAYIDENSYRMIKNIEFNEIDFMIFEVIQGPFPHESAQLFLCENQWADLWVALRYLDSMDDAERRKEILEKMARIRTGSLERIILLCYMLLRHPETPAFEFSADPDNYSSSVPAALIEAILETGKTFLSTGSLDTGWEDRANKDYENEILFALLAFFEISQCELTPGWIRVLEKAVASIWYITVEEGGQKQTYQPLPEFAANILFLFPDDEIVDLLSTSLILPLYLENIDSYSEEVFHDLLHAVMRAEEPFLSELEMHLDRYASLARGDARDRYQMCFDHMGCEVVNEDGCLKLARIEGLS